MKKAAFVITLLLLSCLVAAAQDNPYQGKIAKYVWVEHEQVNPAQGQTYDKVIREFRQTANSSNAETFWLASTPLTGDSHEVTYVTFHDTLASVDKTMAAFQKLEHEIRLKNASFATEAGGSAQSAHLELEMFRPELSLRPDAVDAGHATRLRVTVYHLKPGTGAKFTDFLKNAIELHTKANDHAHWIAYQVIAGAPGPAYVLVTLLHSLADLDLDESAMTRAVFTPIVRQQFDEAIRESVVSTYTTLLALRPEMSRPPRDIIAANPDFWTVKEEPVVAAVKKGRKSAEQPASLKKEAKK